MPPLRCSLALSAHSFVWVTVWVRQLTHILARTIFCVFATKTHRKAKFSVLFVMPYQNRFPAFRKKNHLILRRITIGAYAMLPFRRATAYNSLIA